MRNYARGRGFTLTLRKAPKAAAFETKIRRFGNFCLSCTGHIFFRGRAFTPRHGGTSFTHARVRINRANPNVSVWWITRIIINCWDFVRDVTIAPKGDTRSPSISAAATLSNINTLTGRKSSFDFFQI